MTADRPRLPAAGAQLLLRKAQEFDGEHPPDQAGDGTNDDFERNRPLETVECFGSRAGGIQIPRNNRFVSDLDGIVVADAENQKDKIEKYNRKTGASGDRTEQKENTVVKQDICPGMPAGLARGHLLSEPPYSRISTTRNVASGDNRKKMFEKLDARNCLHKLNLFFIQKAPPLDLKQAYYTVQAKKSQGMPNVTKGIPCEIV